MSPKVDDLSLHRSAFGLLIFWDIVRFVGFAKIGFQTDYLYLNFVSGRQVEV